MADSLQGELRKLLQSGTKDNPALNALIADYRTYHVVLVVVGALFLALVVAANVSTVVNPRQGFSGSISLLASPRPGSSTDDLYRSVGQWLESGSAQTPVVVQSQIDDRLSWQRPKAIVCSVLLVVFAILSALSWRALIRRSRVDQAKWRSKDTVLLLLGTVSVFACLLLMLMAMGNTQGSIAPMSLTLFFG